TDPNTANGLIGSGQSQGNRPPFSSGCPRLRQDPSRLDCPDSPQFSDLPNNHSCRPLILGNQLALITSFGTPLCHHRHGSNPVRPTAIITAESMSAITETNE